MCYQYVNVCYVMLLFCNCSDRLAFPDSLCLTFLVFLLAVFFHEAVNGDVLDLSWN